MSSIAALISDVDGTVMTHAKELTPRTCQAAAELKARGIPFANEAKHIAVLEPIAEGAAFLNATDGERPLFFLRAADDCSFVSIAKTAAALPHPASAPHRRSFV